MREALPSAASGYVVRASSVGRQQLLRVEGVWKTYPGGIVANRGVDLEVGAGEVLALLGENGAGKTTLVSIIAGLVRPDRGSIWLQGRPYRPRGPRDALRSGVVLVPQHPRLVEAYTVAENVGLALSNAGAPRRLGEVEELVEKIGGEYGIRVDPRARVYALSMGEKQRVELVKALALGARLLMLDEPSTHLSPAEVSALIGLVRRLAREGRGVVYITHRISEALEAADRIAVMRRGKVVAVLDAGEAEPRRLLELMFGERLTRAPSLAAAPPAKRGGRELLRVEDIWVRGTHGGWAVRGASFAVESGEVFGIAGVAGNGQVELFNTIVGLVRPQRGRVFLAGVDVTERPPSERGRLGLAVIPEERLGWALVPGKNLVFNTVLGLIHSRASGLVAGRVGVRWASARRAAEEIIERMEVEAPGPEALAEQLSGGNMQRFIVGRELYKKPLILVAMNPTAGLDYAAARRVWGELAGLAGTGGAVVVFSEDLDELLEVSTRIAVMNRGRITAVFERPFEITEIAEAMTA